MTGFLGLRIFIDRSQRITLHDMSPSLLDLHLNEFADVVIFVGTKALILYFGKSFRALVVPESVEEGRVALFLVYLNHRVQITLAQVSRNLLVCILHFDVNNFLTFCYCTGKLRVDTLAD